MKIQVLGGVLERVLSVSSSSFEVCWLRSLLSKVHHFSLGEVEKCPSPLKCTSLEQVCRLLLTVST